MSELVGLVVVLALVAAVLVVVAVVGHGLWLLAASFFRWLAGLTAPRPVGRQWCSLCSAVRAGAEGHCPVCGTELTAFPAAVRRDAEAAVRQLDRLRRGGAISEAAHARLLQAVRGEPVEGPLQLSLPPAPDAAATRPAAAPPALPATEPAVEEGAERGPAPPVFEPADELVEAELVEAEQVETTGDGGTPAAAPVDVPSPPAAPTPSRTLADLLQTFMEEKNIRWGELISGMLIVVSAVGLVISLWATLREAIPYLPALIFMLGTAAFHGAGIYTLRRWNLRQVSRAVLIIGTLLIPLNFLAAIALSGQEGAAGSVVAPSYIAAMIIGLVGYGAMACVAARALMRDGWWRLVIAVMGTSAGQLIIHRASAGYLAWPGVNLLMTLPLASFLVAVVGQMVRARRWPRLSTRRATPIFLVLGVAGFALLAPVGLLLSKSEARGPALAGVAPALSLAAAAILSVGLLIHRKTTARALGMLRTWGTALAILGAFLMLLMVYFAWPRPELLVAAGALSAVLLTLLAWTAELPVLHGAAVGCAAVACLVGFHLAAHSFTGHETRLSGRMIETLLMGSSSVVWTVLAAVVAAVGEAGRRLGRKGDGAAFWWSGAGLAAASTLIALVVGFGGREGVELAAPVLGFHAAALLAAALCLRRSEPAYCGGVLLLACLVQGLALNPVVGPWVQGLALVSRRPVLVGTLCHGNLALLLAAAAAWFFKGAEASIRDARHRTFVIPVITVALASSLLAAPWALWVQEGRFADHFWYALLVASVWAGAAMVNRWPAALVVFQVAASAAVSFAVASLCQRRPWWEGAILDPRHVQAQLAVLALWCLSWSVLRREWRNWPAVRRVVHFGRPTVDQVLLGAVVAGMVMVALYGCAQAMLMELGLDELAGPAGARAEMWHAAASGLGGWIALAFVAVALCGAARERASPTAVAGLLVAGTALPLLAAGPFSDATAAASAARWGFAFYGVAIAAAFCLRTPVARVARRLGWPRWARSQRQSMPSLQLLGAAVTALPVLVLTTLIFIQVASGQRLGGPDAGSIFLRLGPAVSMAGPLGALVVMFVLYAARDRQPFWMLAGSAAFQCMVAAACVLPTLIAGRGLTAQAWGQLLEWEAIGLGVFSLCWLAASRWVEPSGGLAAAPDGTARPPAATGERQPAVRPRDLLHLQIAMAIGSVGLLACWAAWSVIVSPDAVAKVAAVLGNGTSYVAVAATAIACFWLLRGELSRAGVHVAGAVVWSAGCLAAASFSPWNTPGNWLSYHVLIAAWAALAVLASVATCLGAGESERNGGRAAFRSFSRTAAWWAGGAGLLVVLLALRASGADPARPWWPAGGALVATVAAAAAALARRSQPGAYGAMAMAGAAATVFWLGAWTAANLQAVVDLVELNLVAVTLVGAAWLCAEIRFQMVRASSVDSSSSGVRAHHVAAAAALAVFALTVFLGAALATLVRTTGGTSPVEVCNLGGVVTVVLLGALLAGTLWDRAARRAVAGLYAWGLIATVVLIEAWRLELAHEFFAAGMAAAGYVAVTGTLWQSGAWLAKQGQRLGVPDPVAALRSTSRWLPAANLCLAFACAMTGLVVVLAFEQRELRITAGFAPALAAVGVAALAQQRRRPAMQLVSLLLVALSATYLTWADMEPSLRGAAWLTRMIRLLIVLSAVAFMYSVVVARRLRPTSDWLGPVRRAAVAAAGAALVVLAAVLLIEAALFIQDPQQGAPVDDVQLAAVSVVLVGLVAALLGLALLPGRDPLGLSEAGRMWYVYGAQLTAALLFAHLYLARPQWFGGILREYWPYVVLAIAFGGVGVGELFQRSGVRVLAEPLQRSGAFLPLLPVLGWWVIASETSYALLLFVVGLVYVLLSISRRSWASGAAAALAGNGALWALLGEQGFQLLRQPQLWMVPPALSVLIAAEINRRRLPDNVLTAMRYACLIVIYLSSTSEMFLRGIGQQLWPPMVLLGLSLAGALAGVALRIRAFLYLGSCFIFLSVVSMVWHASRAIQHVWPWWAFGIGLGLCILVMFGMFEKNREGIQQFIERLRQWDR